LLVNGSISVEKEQRLRTDVWKKSVASVNFTHDGSLRNEQKLRNEVVTSCYNTSPRLSVKPSRTMVGSLFREARARRTTVFGLTAMPGI
jgi:hypothetical protein